MRTVLSFACFQINTSASFCQFAQHLYISPKNRLKELCPKECVYKLPIDTLTQALMHANTRTPTVYVPSFPLCRRSR